MKKTVPVLIIGCLAMGLVGCNSAPTVQQSISKIECGDKVFSDDSTSNITVEGKSTYSVAVKGNDVDVNTVGEQNVTYIITDANGKEYEKQLKYEVVDTTPPTIDMASNSIVVAKGKKMNPLDYVSSVSDAGDKTISKSSITIDGNVDTENLGFHSVNMVATDASNNSTSVVLEYEVINELMHLDTPTNFDNKVEITVKSADFKEKIVPSNPRSYYSYYQSKISEGKIYYDVVFMGKNLGTEEIEMDGYIKANLLYDEKYSYSGFMVTESNGDLEAYHWYSDVDPLTSKLFHYIFELPLEARSSGKSIVVNFQVDEAKNVLVAR